MQFRQNDCTGKKTFWKASSFACIFMGVGYTLKLIKSKAYLRLSEHLFQTKAEQFGQFLDSMGGLFLIQIFFFALKMVFQKNENAGKLITFQWIFLDIFKLRLNSVVFFILLISYSNMQQTKVIWQCFVKNLKSCTSQIGS